MLFVRETARESQKHQRGSRVLPEARVTETGGRTWLNKKTIAVMGATGAQGGGLVRAILADPEGGFAARAVTRDVNSDSARALADLGAEVVAADVSDQASLRRAFEGAYGAYCVTFFWEHFSPEKEGAHVQNMAAAAKEAGLQHVIWSTLEDTRQWVPLDDDRMPTLMGTYKVPHFDAKGESDRIFTEYGVPTTYLLTSFYWDNLIHFGMGPQPGPGRDPRLHPAHGRQAKLPGIAAEDIGTLRLRHLQAGRRIHRQHGGDRRRAPDRQRNGSRAWQAPSASP